jgi:DNA mismatch repair ATPase MutS
MQPDLFDASLAGPVRRFTDDQIARAQFLHPGMVLLFRVGDSYELFGEDATLGSRLLGLELQGGRQPFVRFQVQSLETNLRMLLHAGHRVAVCDREEVQ